MGNDSSSSISNATYNTPSNNDININRKATSGCKVA